MKKYLSVSAIENGTVIDHIPAGCAFDIIRLLGLLKNDAHVTVGIRLPSGNMGEKDLVKISERTLTDEEANRVAVFAPRATVNIIRDFEVEKKITVALPERIAAVFACPNPQCITNHEPTETKFAAAEHDGVVSLTCHYCEKTFPREEIKVGNP